MSAPPPPHLTAHPDDGPSTTTPARRPFDLAVVNIALLTHRVPYPIESGQNLRLYHLARVLARSHDLHLVAFGDTPYPATLTPIFRTIATLPAAPPAPTPFTPAKLLRALRAPQLIEHRTAMQALVQEVQARVRPDAVWVGGWDMLVYSKGLSNCRIVADAMDEGFLEASREVRRARTGRAFVTSTRRLIDFVRWERCYFPHADVCLFTSSLDARWASRIVSGLRVAVVENGVDGEYFRPLHLDEEFPSLVFEGNQGFQPNADAVGYFVHSVLPILRRRFPACRLYVVGRDPLPSIRALAGPDVVVTGRVDDVRPFVDRASVFVCPMQTGAGIKNKILQAWAMAKAVVATPIAAGGLRSSAGEDIVIAHGPADFAREVGGLLGDPVRRRLLGKRARETALTHYSWERQALALERLLAGT